MSTTYLLVSNKIKEIFRETFFSLEKSSNTTSSHLNTTRNYNATFMDRVVTSSGLAILTYICLIVGSVGSLIVKNRKKNDPSIEIDVISKDSAKSAPFVASGFLFGIFVLSKFIPIHYLITLFTYYIIMYTMCSSYVIVEEMILSVVRIPLETFSLNIQLKNMTKDLFKMSLKFTYATLLSLPICGAFCAWYILSNKHWILSNVIAMFIAIYAMAYVHIQKLYHAIILLSSLLVYDIFWVYGTNVMLTVATKMDAPVKLLFPNDFIVNGFQSKSLSLLGLGDVVIPGLYLALLLRYDTNAFPKRKPWFFICGLIFYGLGMLLTNVVLYVFKSGQPALLYLVPALFLGTATAQAFFGNPLNDILQYDDEIIVENKSEKVE